MKLGRFLVNVVLVVLAFAGGAMFGLKPWEKYNLQRKATEAQEGLAKQSEQEHVRDMLLDAKYRTVPGHEELVRQQGFLKPDEIPLAP